MKIDGTGKPLAPTATSATKSSSANNPTTATSSAAAPGAQVDISGTSSRLRELEASVANVPVVDSARVDEIKQAIADGRFKVNADRVADSLIESVRQMLNTRPAA
ncbi:MAG: flagellar biosynthesis anti-sigma factor FlgM [Methyloversatilis sp.]|uniref:flagellar biosynthesis anti-sigma factor FlgM n=1 Tax=Methyloversatilis sp. TaxID=2569862 RepID=UPI002734E52E|nr:flagellar biosynthesis anti-sigma factor FlgM [Methyloversatilis sp.]MDP3871384.1 flagellar biosynthesis anti-sigma factor FlgM [Methyloversatilis sp.]